MVDISGVAVGGAGLGRWPDGRVVFVPGALPGERVQAEAAAERRRHVDARLVTVTEPSPERQAEPCPHRLRGCGGCDWMHVTLAGQRRFKAELAAQVLGRAAGVEGPVVRSRPVEPTTGYRTTVRVAVDERGRPAYRAASSHDLVAVDSCLVAHPAIAGVLAGASFPAGSEVTIRTSVATGEVLVVVDPAAAGLELGDGIRVLGGDELRSGRRAWLHEAAAGRRWRVSARSFFQASPAAATALSEEVVAALGEWAAPTRLLDLYAGVGLLGGSVGDWVGGAVDLVAVESSASSAADARVNLAHREAKVLKTAVERLHPPQAELVVADPPRRGLGRRAVGVIDRARSRRLALVSCDLGALGRDAELLGESGWSCLDAVAVDAFPHTSHVEVVTAWAR